MFESTFFPTSSFYVRPFLSRDEFIKETDQAYLLSFDMHGVSKENLDVSIEQTKVTVNRTRKSFNENSSEAENKISRVIAIPDDVDRDLIQAKILDGVFYLALPKLEKEKSKKIEVSNGTEFDEWSKLIA